VHFGAQAGVRHSLLDPYAYIDSNIAGFLNVLEGCRQSNVEHLVFASSSSVYGTNSKVPFAVTDPVDHPVSLYGATKKANELMAHSYSHLYGIPVTGLRFFTVYGPWGRPDMAYFKFTQAILAGKPIDLYNYGKMQRDFTYIDDIVEGVLRVLTYTPGTRSAGISRARYNIYNIGNNKPVELMYFVEILEQYLGKRAVINMLPLQPGDVLKTYADVDALIRDLDFRPRTPIETGLARFCDWFCAYYGVDRNIARTNEPAVPVGGQKN
jgi:UDP-glucuronate 4-epimerase